MVITDPDRSPGSPLKDPEVKSVPAKRLIVADDPESVRALEQARSRTEPRSAIGVRSSVPNPHPAPGDASTGSLGPENGVPAWYDLDRYARFRDPATVVGFGLVVYGVSRWTVPGAEVLAGLGLMAVGYLMSR